MSTREREKHRKKMFRLLGIITVPHSSLLVCLFVTVQEDILKSLSNFLLQACMTCPYVKYNIFERNTSGNLIDPPLTTTTKKSTTN